MSVSLFDANFYKTATPDLAVAGLSTDAQLLLHFQSSGIDEGRLFSTSNYKLLLNISPSIDTVSSTNTAYEIINILVNSGIFPPDSGVISDLVGDIDTDNYYNFNLLEDASFSVEFEKFSADTDLYLYDSNGFEIGFSVADGTNTDSINRFLTASTYFLRVAGFSSNTNYNLQY